MSAGWAIFSHKMARHKRYGACDELVPVVGLEPTRCFHQRLLSGCVMYVHRSSPQSSVAANPCGSKLFYSNS